MREERRRSGPGFRRRKGLPETIGTAFESWVLYEDNHLLAVNKPAMLPTMGVTSAAPSLWTLAKQYIKQRYKKPGNVYLGVVSRLDAPVTGVLLLARTSKAAARLSKQFRQSDVDKWYLAVVCHPLDPPAGRCVDWLRKDERRQRMCVARHDHPAAREARLTYRTLRGVGRRRLLEIRLETGRKHQIRVQLAHRDSPVLGDRKYGNQVSFSQGIALHSRQLVLEHPVQRSKLTIVAPLPASWASLGIPME